MADEFVDRARALMEKGNAKAVYQLLSPLQSERAGDPDFDYLLGVAALDLGKPTEAVFALERVLAVQPNNAPARAEIARAYFNLRETDAAKREFENVKRQNVPAPVTRTIDKYLQAIDRAEAGSRFSIRGYAEGFAGYDSNVNSATSDRSVAVPAFGGLVFGLSENSSKLSDSYYGGQGGLNLRAPLNEQWALIASATGNRRLNSSRNEFDSSFIDVAAGATYKRNRDLFTLVAQYNTFHLYNISFPNAFRTATGATAQWQRDLNARNQITFYAQYSSLDYPDQGVRNANRYVLGGGYAHATRTGASVYVGGYLGTEKQTDSSRPNLGHDLIGFRAGADYPWTERITAFGNLAYEYRKYGGDEPLFLKTRNDNQYSAAIGLHFVPAQDWRITPQIVGIVNDSNISINKYDRLFAEIRVRRSF